MSRKLPARQPITTSRSPAEHTPASQNTARTSLFWMVRQYDAIWLAGELPPPSAARHRVILCIERWDRIRLDRRDFVRLVAKIVCVDQYRHKQCNKNGNKTLFLNTILLWSFLTNREHLEKELLSSRTTPPLDLHCPPATQQDVARNNFIQFCC